MSTKILGVNHIMISVGDIDVAKEFYDTIMEFEEIPIPPEITGPRIWYQLGPSVLHVNYHPEHQAGLQHFGLNIEPGKFDTYYESIKSKGYDKMTEPMKHVDGLTRFFVRDPFGNDIEISDYA